MILSILGAFLTAFATVFFSIKKLIHIAYAKHLFDEPTEKRKIHVRRTPNLGGISIFAALLFSSSLFVETHNILFVRYSIVASLILFFVGVVDDLVGLNPLKKFIAQVAVAILVVVPGGTHFSGFYGIFGLHALPDYINILTSISFVLLLVNAFNLIDGINCLAAGIGLVICIAYSYFFWMLQAHWLLIIAVSMSGALIGFMIFNRTPAKIFMGDSGSLILGLVISILTINFVELNSTNGVKLSAHISSGPSVALSLLIIPIFDTIRIFSVRLLNKKSPFQADRNHIHHRLIDIGFSHLQAAGILTGITVVYFLLSFFASDWRNEILISIITVASLLLNRLLSLALSKTIHGLGSKQISGSLQEFEITAKIVKPSKKISVFVSEE